MGVAMPRVSIIIPVYNVEKYLRECLDSVVNQTLKDIEIICVNDGSPDNSLAILEEYAQLDNRIRIINKENGGLGSARNVGIKEVTSEYVMFLDSDDWLELNACELAYEQISRNKNDFVIFGTYIHSMKRKKKKFDSAKIVNFSNIKGNSAANTSDIKVPFWSNAECWYKIYSTKFLKENALEFDKGAYEDQRFNIRIYALAKSISVLEVPLYNYRKRANSITALSSNWKAFINAKMRGYELIKDIELPSAELRQFYVIYLIESILFYFFKLGKKDRSIREEFYSEIHKFFTVLDAENNIKELRDYVDYKVFRLFVGNETYRTFKIQKIMKVDIFSVRNSCRARYITILGAKLRIKNKRQI